MKQLPPVSASCQREAPQQFITRLFLVRFTDPAHGHAACCSLNGDKRTNPVAVVRSLADGAHTRIVHWRQFQRLQCVVHHREVCRSELPDQSPCACDQCVNHGPLVSPHDVPRHCFFGPMFQYSPPEGTSIKNFYGLKICCLLNRCPLDFYRRSCRPHHSAKSAAMACPSNWRHVHRAGFSPAVDKSHPESGSVRCLRPRRLLERSGQLIRKDDVGFWQAAPLPQPTHLDIPSCVNFLHSFDLVELEQEHFTHQVAPGSHSLWSCTRANREDIASHHVPEVLAVANVKKRTGVGRRCLAHRGMPSCALNGVHGIRAAGEMARPYTFHKRNGEMERSACT